MIVLFAGCKNGFNLMNGDNPAKRSFKYYNAGFKFDGSSPLKCDQKYVLVSGTNSVDILVFFKDGFLNKHATTGINGASVNRMEKGTIMGYYKMIQDSIFFTTASYYQHQQTYYKGKIDNDTLTLLVKYPKHKIAVTEKYILVR
jgi:hypothetical protein